MVLRRWPLYDTHCKWRPSFYNLLKRHDCPRRLHAFPQLSNAQVLRPAARELAHNFENAHHPYEERQGGRSWEDYYRRRWQHDKVVRSTHGVNCTGSCSFDVFVKDGIIVWEAQKTDYPTPHPDFPDYEPRGCPSRRLRPRGTSTARCA